MSDLLVDYAELLGTASELAAVANVTHETAASTGASQGLAGAAGHAAVVSAGRDFLGRWKFGMDKLTDDARGLGKILESTVAAFTDVDTQVGEHVPPPVVQVRP